MSEAIAAEAVSPRTDLVLAQLDAAPGLSTEAQTLLRSDSNGDVRQRLVSSVIRSFQSGRPASNVATAGLNPREFWRHSVATAMAAEILHGQKNGFGVFTAGLLHDVGKIVLALAMPKSYQRVVRMVERSGGDLPDVEETVLGVDHCAAGRRWAQKQGLGPHVLQTIWFHHLPPHSLPADIETGEIIRAVQAADALVKRMNIGWSGQRRSIDAGEIELSPQLEEALLAALEPTERWIETALQGARENSETDRRGGNAESRCLEGLEWLARGLTNHDSVLETVSLAAGAICRGLSLSVIVYASERNSGTLILGLASGEEVEAEVCDCGSIDADAKMREAEWRFRSQFGGGPIHRVEIRTPADFPGIALIEGTEAIHGGSDTLFELAGQAIGAARNRENAQRLIDQLVSAQRRQAAVHMDTLSTRALESVVAMAAGAAHELNNPLTVISGRAQMLGSRTDDPIVRAEAEAIARQAQAASDIVTELMNFARPRPPEPTDVNLREITGEVCGELERSGLLGQGETAIEVSSDTPLVRFDRKYLGDLLREMLLNAIEATEPEARQLTVKATSDPAEDVVVVDVIDNGRGMTAAIRARALDPFFSWRPAGRGRGLGLSKVVRYLADGGGALEMGSEPGAGTRIRLRLPAAKMSR